MVSILLVVMIMAAGMLGAANSSSVWTGGYQLSVEGFDGEDPFFPGEYAALQLFFEPFSHTALSPRLSFGALVPLFAQQHEATWLEFQMGIRLFTLQNHPLDAVFLRDSALTPRVQVGVMAVPTQLSEPVYTLLLEPFAFFFGEKTVSVLGLQVYYDSHTSHFGWALQLFDISRFLF